jgi:hypothetical protein
MHKLSGPRSGITRRAAFALITTTAVGVGIASAMGESGPRAGRPPGDEIDLERLRTSLARRAPIPFEVLATDDAKDNADEIISDGWQLGAFPITRLDLPIDWTTLCMSNRSWNYRLHAWSFMAPVLRAYADTGNRRYLDWCVERAASWARVFNNGDARGTEAWYDMAVGRRGYRLAYLVEQALINGLGEGTASLLLTCVTRHQRELLADRAFNPRTNHGFYVAAGQLALARRLRELPAMDVLEVQGRERMGVMARSQFAEDGGHLEHSPEYHWLLLESFRGALEAGLLDDAEVRRRITLAGDVLGWLIQPNGELVQVGDSSPRHVRSAQARTSSPTTNFLISTGRRGKPTRERLKVLANTGYAIVRSPQPRGPRHHEASSYLFLMAAFHSRAHKHADDLSITWFDRKREILVDAGRYGYVHDILPADSPLRRHGYYYSAPERQYVESTRAHNTVEADGVNHDRVARQPYGSAIVGAEERDGHFRLEAKVDHGAWHHHREILFRPGRWLRVIDDLRAQADATHDYRAWWNFPADLAPTLHGPGTLVIDIPDSERLWVVESSGAQVMAPVTGRRDPLRGWRSKADLELTPAWSTGFEALGVHSHRFETLFSFGDDRPATSPSSPFDHTPASSRRRR